MKYNWAAVPIQTSKGFRWNLDLNYGANSSKVVKLDDEGLITSYQLYSSGIQILASVGEAYGTLFGTSYVRDANGNVVVDANGLPKISTTNKTLGKFTPDWTGGISNTFSYRSLSLSFLIDASVGGSIFSNTNKTGKYTGVLANTLSGRDVPSTVACGIILTPWVTMYDYQNLLLIPYPPMDFTMPRSMGNPPVCIRMALW